MKAFWSLVLFIGATVLVGAQAIDNTAVATVKLTKTTLITQKQWDAAVNEISQSRGARLSDADRARVLDSLIDSELLKQGADKAGIKVSEAEILGEFRQQMIAQLHANNPAVPVANLPSPSDDQVKSTVTAQYNTTWEKFVAEASSQFAVRKFLGQAKDNYPKVTLAPVTDADIRAYHEDNIASYVVPELVRVSHIFFDTKTKPNGTLAEIRKRAEDTRKKIDSKQASFEEMVSQVSEDESSNKKNGDLGYLLRAFDTSAAGQAASATYGRDFLRQLFTLPVNEVSAVLTSNAGLHIVKITVKRDKHFLGLDEDLQAGGNGGKVRDSIRKILENQHAMAYQTALGEALVADLRSQAGKNGIQYLKKAN